jgi:alanyl-tRNA synthetase
MSLTIKEAGSLPPTEKLFIADPYRRECQARVLYCRDNLIVTDATIFYAEAGGQVADQGWIENARVIDVQKAGGRCVFLKREGISLPPVQIDTLHVHQLEQPAQFQTGQTVTMKLDWPLRYSHMRYHSAAHFLYQAVNDIYGQAGQPPLVKGCYIHAKSARFDYGKLAAAHIPAVAARANQLIARNAEIHMEFDPQAKEIGFWRYGDDVLIPCGGTHVRHAREVGPIAVKRKSQGKFTDRVYAYLDRQ